MAYIGEATGGEISIHALREEGDFLCLLGSSTLINFYPRPPRGGRPGRRNVRRLVGVFLSTPSARRATGTAQCTQAGRSISIHALREEGDLYSASCSFSRRVFLSTPSARRATCPSAVSLQLLPYFYPRPPRGGRQEWR